MSRNPHVSRTGADPLSAPRQVGDDGGSDATEVGDGVWAVPFEMPGTGVPYSLGYVLDDGSGGLHVIDSGCSTTTNQERLDRLLRRLGRSITDIATLVATHLHPDHLGMHDLLRERSGARLLMHREEDAAAMRLQGTSALLQAFERWDEWGVPDAYRASPPRGDSFSGAPFHRPADGHLSDHDELPIPGRRITALCTPGHTAGHLVFCDHDTGILFTGDHVLPTRHAGLRLGGPHRANPLAEYIASLRRAAEVEATIAAPGHEHPFTDIRERTLSSAEHHLRRSREVESALIASPDASVWEVAGRMSWRAGIESLSGYYFVSALAQTAMHIDYVRAGGETSAPSW